MNPSSTEKPLTRRSRPIAIGVAAGVLAGGAIGFAAVSPTFTSAAADDTTVSSTTVVVSPADDTDGTAETGPIGEDVQEPAGRLRDVLQPLVDDGTVDATQADAVATFLVEHRPERTGGLHDRRGLDGHGPDHSVVADLLGVDIESLRVALQSGQSIADVAEAQGVDVQTVIDGLVADAQSHLDLAVDHGLDEEAAANRLQRLTERIEDGVHRTRSRPADG
ncbi:MAG: hypothetical protein ABIP17_03290 [Ilumatobacteraceae bacterium]